MSPTESAYAAAFLDELGERYGNDGCNDFFLPNTPENRKLVQAALNWNSQDPEERKIHTHKGLIETDNYLIAGYLGHLLKVESGVEKLPKLDAWPRMGRYRPGNT